MDACIVMSRTLCAATVCLCWLTVGVQAGPEGVRGVDSAKGAVQTIVGNNGQQSLQAVLYSIEERLRGLDLVYAPRYPPPSRHWDSEQSARRLDAVDARLSRIEALLELRLDKIIEAVSGNHMKQTLANDQMTRKIDALYERLSLRIHHIESRLDLGVTKIKSDIESGFVRIAQTERDSDSIEADFETQLNDLQKQFNGFETTQNATAAALTELSSSRCKRGELNDAENVVKDFTKQDVEQFATSMENVATKVNKMVTDFGQRTQAMESLVKNSMSLANATRRELQDGLRSLGLRIVYHGTKHNKEKESSFENGWDALAKLLVSEFGDLSTQLTSNHNTLTAAQEEFRNNCYRIQDQDQQLSAHIANLLDKTLDITDNRSQEVAKRLGTLGEIIKSHGSDGRRHDSRDKNIELMPQQLNAIDSVLQVIKQQVAELASLNAANEDAKENCLDASQVVDKVALSIDSRQVLVEETSRLVAEKVIAFINESRNEDKVFAEDEEFLHLEEFARKAEKESKASKRKSFLDIAEEELGETLEYNVTEDAETKAPVAEGLRRKAVARESNEFEFDKSQHEGDTDYDDDEEGNDDNAETSESLIKKIDRDIKVDDAKEKINGTKVDPSIGGDALESGPESLPAERNQGGVASMEVDSIRNREEYVGGDKTNFSRDDIDPPKFSDYWHRLKNVSASDLSGNGKGEVKVASKGQNGLNVKNVDVGTSHRRNFGEDHPSADKLHLGLDHQANINHEEEEYDYGD